MLNYIFLNGSSISSSHLIRQAASSSYSVIIVTKIFKITYSINNHHLPQMWETQTTLLSGNTEPGIKILHFIYLKVFLSQFKQQAHAGKIIPFNFV